MFSNWQHYFWLRIMSILGHFTCLCFVLTSATEITTLGWTSPAGDMTLEVGESLRIRCTLNRTLIDQPHSGVNSSFLVFWSNGKPVSPADITIIDDMTIELFIYDLPPAREMYSCCFLHPDWIVGNNTVVIGYKPQKPANFKCVPLGSRDIKCSWEPIHNYVKTYFSLVFDVGDFYRECLPTDEHGMLLPENSCRIAFEVVLEILTAHISVKYQASWHWSYLLTARNSLGQTKFRYRFPNVWLDAKREIQNLVVVNKTTESAYLQWLVPDSHLLESQHHKIAWKNHRANKTWEVKEFQYDNLQHDPPNIIVYNLTALKYANTYYNVVVSLETQGFYDDTKYKSNELTLEFQTLPKVPSLPPKTVNGCFEIVENDEAIRDLYLYWQSIPPYLENGENFTYKFTKEDENGHRSHIMPSEVTRTYAKFNGIHFNTSHWFTIASHNIMGPSSEKARIYVPKWHEKPPAPLAFTKIQFSHQIFELSWKPPLISKGIISYTLFWCDNNYGRPAKCDGYLDWITVPTNTTIKNITVPLNQTYEFAIAANTHNTSSGMIWATCNIIYYKPVEKMKLVWMNRMGFDDIDVGWKLECANRMGIVEGFNIYYCQIYSLHNCTCKEAQEKKTIQGDYNTIHGIITGLKPYTSYKITVTVFTRTKEGSQSDPLFATTREASPSTAPQNIKIGNVTNSTMFISWDPPPVMNGVLRQYEVNYDSHSLKISGATNITLKDLIPYKNYTITVRACTVKCSVESQPISHMTDIGVPGKIASIPYVTIINSTHLKLNFAISKPTLPGGMINYYQIYTGSNEVINTSKLEMELPIPDCQAEANVYKFKVRAVNIDKHRQHLYGPWYESGENKCDPPQRNTWVYISLVGILAAILGIYGFIKTRRRCRVMQDIQVIDIPLGLLLDENQLQRNTGKLIAHQVNSVNSTKDSEQVSTSRTTSLSSGLHICPNFGKRLEVDGTVHQKPIQSSSKSENSQIFQPNAEQKQAVNLTNRDRLQSMSDEQKSSFTVGSVTEINPVDTSFMPQSTVTGITPGEYVAVGSIIDRRNK